ncbi:hypothetical protein Agub_g13295, partial [Astrephomene gubernaculifera]
MLWQRGSCLLIIGLILSQAWDSQGCYKRLAQHGQFPLLYIDDCASNYDLGLLVGSTFSSMIKERLRDSIAFEKVTSYCATAWGRQLLSGLQPLHAAAYPAYMAELAGLAAGSELPFEQIFMLNLRQEILAAAENPDLRLTLQHRLEEAAAARSGGMGGSSRHSIRGGAGARSEAEEGLRSARMPVADGACGDNDGCGDSGSGGAGMEGEMSSSRGGGGLGGSDDDSTEQQWVDPASVDACSDVG